MERAFSRVTKEAIDQSPQPGDQSLDGWWIRSQSNWTGGAGYRFMEPIGESPIERSFHWSYGVDPWTEGRLTLHRKPGQACEFQCGLTVPGDPQIASFGAHMYISYGLAVYRFDLQDVRTPGWTFSGLPAPFATFPSRITQLVAAGNSLLASTLSNGVYKVDGATNPNMFTATQGSIRMWWVKERLLLASGRTLWEQPIPSTTVDLSTQTPVISIQESTWEWVSATDTPASIFVAGRGANSSSITAIGLDDSGSLPELDSPIVVAEFPRPESVLNIRSYLGTYLMISTTAGVRLGIVDNDSRTSIDRLTYGPLLRTPVLTSDFSFFDKYAYAAVADAGEGRSGLIRFDLSEVSNETRVAWAFDVRVDTGHRIIAQEILGRDYVFMVSLVGNRAHLWTSTPFNRTEDYGVIQSGNVRMGSTIAKNWSRVALEARPPMRGAVAAFLVSNEYEAEVGRMTNPEYKAEWRVNDPRVQSGYVALRLVIARGALPEGLEPPPPPDPEPDIIPDPEPAPPAEPGEESWNSLRVLTWRNARDTFLTWRDFILNEPDDGVAGGVGIGGVVVNPVETDETPETGETVTGSPILESWAIRAIPAIERTELMRIPLLCFDLEKDTRGQQVGRVGAALERYDELVERTRGGVVVKMRNLNTQRTYRCVVDDMSFRQTAKDNRGSGFGGVVDLVVRVL